MRSIQINKKKIYSYYKITEIIKIKLFLQIVPFCNAIAKKIIINICLDFRYLGQSEKKNDIIYWDMIKIINFSPAKKKQIEK